MTRDHSLALRQAVVQALRAASPVNTKVGARVFEYVQSEPEWPFVRVDLPPLENYEATGIDGGELALTVHSFAKGRGSDAVAALNAAITRALDGQSLTLAEGYLIALDHVRTETVSDPNGYHGIIRFYALTGEEP